MAGRPTKYTEEMVKKILGGIRAGLTDKDAALIAGIDIATMNRWELRYADFAQQVARAHASRSGEWLDRIRMIAVSTGDWRAYAELLDRCSPEYRKTTTIEHTGKDGTAAIRFEIVSSRTPEVAP